MDEIPFRPELEKIKEYIAGRSTQEALQVAPGTKPIKLASNENPLGPSPKVVEVLHKISGGVSVYPDQNATLLREGIAKRLSIKPENIITGNGSDEIMQMIGLAFLSAGEESIISRVTFSIYEFVTTLLGGRAIFVEQIDGKYNVSAIQKSISRKTRLIWIANPNNPTGTYINHVEMRSLLDTAPTSVYIILDEAYAEYAEAHDFPNALQLMEEHPQLIILRTFSKAYGLAGLRMGYALAAPRIIQILNKTRLPFNVNSLAQGAALAALEDDDHMTRSKKNNSDGKNFLYGALKNLNISFWKTEANFVCLHLPRKLNADKAFMDMMKKGMVVRPLTSFGLPQALRVTIGTSEQNEKFIAALKEVIA